MTDVVEIRLWVKNPKANKILCCECVNTTKPQFLRETSDVSTKSKTADNDSYDFNPVFHYATRLKGTGCCITLQAIRSDIITSLHRYTKSRAYRHTPILDIASLKLFEPQFKKTSYGSSRFAFKHSSLHKLTSNDALILSNDTRKILE